MALFARNAPGVLHADLAACNDWKTGPDAAGRVRCPALVVVAANDIMTPAKNGAELARLVPGARTVTLRIAATSWSLEQPDATLDALIEFFAPQQ